MASTAPRKPTENREPGAPHRFPDTRESLVQALASTESAARVQAFDFVVRAYRTPVVVLLSRKWSLSHEDAEDLAQEFFVRALEKEWFARYEPERGRFRTFLRTCLLAFAADEHDRAHRQKRGGHAAHESLSDLTVQPAGDDAIDELFEQEWIRSVMQLALDALREEAMKSNREAALQIFEEYDVRDAERPTYAQLAVRWNLPVTQVTNYLAWARKRFRYHLLNTVRSLTGSEQEYRDELRTLLGMVPE